MPEISPEAQKAIEEAVAFYPGGWTHQICAFQKIHRGSGVNQGGGRTGAVCHASATGAGPNVILVNAHRPKWHRDFTLWVAQGSPFSHGVLNKDNEKEITGHASVIDLALVGDAGALWLCKAFRHNEEDHWKPAIWEKLQDHGLTGFQAFIGCDILDPDGNPSHGNTHTSLFGYSTPTDLRETYESMLKAGLKKGGHQAAHYGKFGALNWGSLTTKAIKKPDGWGGFAEIKQPCDVKEYAAKLKEIFEGDPKNVG